MRIPCLYTGYLLLLLLPFCAVGQNLVPNPSFEDYKACPTAISAIDYSPGYTSFPWVQGWVSPLQKSSPDYFNACAAANTGAQTPLTAFGYQQPRTGDAYAGIVAWEGYYSGASLTSEFREYIQCKLLQPLQAGTRYCVSFYVSPSYNLNGNFNYQSINEVGINFGKAQTSYATGYTLSLPYHVVSPKNQFLSDTGKWIKVSGEYIAQGGEEWLTLGCFTNGSGALPGKTQAYPIPASSTLSTQRAYLFIDDVHVFPVSKNDTTYTVIDSPYCTLSAFPMKLTSTGVDGTYWWSIGEITPSIVVTTPGTYWCVCSTDCQVFVDTFKVAFKPDSKLKFNKSFVNCENQPVEVKADKPFDTYAWSTGESTQAITVSKSGKYVLTGTNRCGTQTDTAHVYIQPPTPAPKVADTFICQLVKDPVLHAEGENLNWYTHPAGLVGTPVQPTVVTRDVTKYTFYLTQTVGACESPKAPMNIEIKYQPRHILDDKAIMCIDNIQVIGKEASDEIKYKWSTGQTECCIRPTTEGLHRVGISSAFCGTYIDSTRVVFSLCDTCITMPNAFSPNHDGRNDKFKPIIICPLNTFHMSIFDRWGKKVFESFDANADWDGYDANRVPSDNGVYVYTIEYRSTATNIPRFANGNITLLR